MGVPKPAARMTDPTLHGGVIVSGDSTVLIGDMPAARIGDSHTCPLIDAKPHVGGTIMTGSTTVMIGDAFAARMGDQCPCSGGVSGVGVPPKLPGFSTSHSETGPSSVGGFDKPTNVIMDGDRKMVEYQKKGSLFEKKDEMDLIGKDGKPIFHYEKSERGPAYEGKETVVYNEDGDVVYTKGSGSAELYQEQEKGSLNLNIFGKELEIAGEDTTKYGYAEGEGHIAGEPGGPPSIRQEGGGTGKAEVGAVKETKKVSIGPKGGQNPYAQIELSGDVAKAEAKANKLAGYDGKRAGVAVGGKAGASLVSGSVKGTWDAGLAFPPLLLLRNIGYNVEITAEVGADAGSVGIGLDGHAYYDLETKRVNVGVAGKLAELIGLKCDLNISIGKMKGAGKKPVALAGIPNTIAMGCTTVLIG